ncbi:MAG: cold shock domain-containing protein [Paucibacter sp.]|nr:cold shock domain-containing protein [Roseateles sp.]
MSEVRRFEGELVLWHGERGFGAIMPRHGGQEVFVHVSAFPRDGAPPAVHDQISFEIVSDGEGRKRAARVQRLSGQGLSGQGRNDDVTRVLGRSTGAMALRRRREERRRRLTYTVVGLALVIVALGWMQFSVPSQSHQPSHFASTATGPAHH